MAKIIGLAKTAYILIISVLILGFALISSKPVYAIDGFVNVTYPNGGQTFTEGDKVTITWDSSPNIDKVAIMYKTDQHHENWVAFTAPNTNTYTWTVDVGNTTNTQFYIEIIGYETGKGSITNFGNYFTINQKPDAPPSPTPTPQPSSTPSNPNQTPTPRQIADEVERRIFANIPSWKPSATPTPTPAYKPWSVYSVSFTETFWFEGSLTTDISKIKDPKKVENFTLDTKYGWTYELTQTVDLTDSDRVKLLKNIGDYWVVDWEFIYIKETWWEEFKIPAEVVYKNDKLTSTPPVIKTSNSEKEDLKVEVKESKPGEVKAALTGAGKVEILPKVEFINKEKLTTDKDNYVLKARSSHKDFLYKIKINGEEKDFKPQNFNEKTGEFEVPVNNLVQGYNAISLLYKNPSNKDSDKFALGDEAGIKMEIKSKLLSYLGISAGFLTSFVALGLIVWQRLLITKKFKELIKKILKKQ